MKSIYLLLLLSPLGAVAQEVAEGAEQVIPQAFPTSRYEASWSKNPFLLKTTAVSQPTVSFAQDWVISGMYQLPSGKKVVNLMNRQTGERTRVTSDGDEAGEFRLVEATIAPRTSESSAKVAKGSEEATLKYDDQLLSRALSTPAPAPAPQAMGGRPGVQVTPQQAQANARAAVAAASASRGVPGGGASPGGGGPIVVGQPSQMAQNGVGANGLPPGVILPGGVPATGTNNGVSIDLTGGNNNGSTANLANPNTDGTETAPATVTRRRRLIPASTLNNP